jgi:hypothetical protein
MSVFPVMPRIVGNSVAQITGMFARSRTAPGAYFIGDAGIIGYVRLGRRTRIGCTTRVLIDVLAGVGQVARPVIGSLSRLFGFARRNPAEDFVRLTRIRIRDRTHRDVHIITRARRRHLREHSGRTERKHQG